MLLFSTIIDFFIQFEAPHADKCSSIEFGTVDDVLDRNTLQIIVPNDEAIDAENVSGEEDLNKGDAMESECVFGEKTATKQNKNKSLDAEESTSDKHGKPEEIMKKKRKRTKKIQFVERQPFNESIENFNIFSVLDKDGKNEGKHEYVNKRSFDVATMVHQKILTEEAQTSDSQLSMMQANGTNSRANQTKYEKKLNKQDFQTLTDGKEVPYTKSKANSCDEKHI